MTNHDDQPFFGNRTSSEDKNSSSLYPSKPRVELSKAQGCELLKVLRPKNVEFGPEEKRATLYYGTDKKFLVISGPAIDLSDESISIIAETLPEGLHLKITYQDQLYEISEPSFSQKTSSAELLQYAKKWLAIHKLLHIEMFRYEVLTCKR